MNDIIYDIAFTFDESLTPIEKVALHRKYGSTGKIFSLNKSTIKNILGRKWTGTRFDALSFVNKAESVLNYLTMANIKFIRYDDPEYPEGLRMIPDCPFIIYYRGDIKYDFNQSIAIVGTRKPNKEGYKRTKEFTSSLTKNSFTIISGLAHGVDTAAHYNCLMEKGKTIAVLGCGIDRIYPFINKDLARMILDNGGGIISEYPPTVPPKKWNFPRRNRIIVGLSRAVLITQSPSRSGSLISAMLAADYNRDLFVAAINDDNDLIDAGNRELILTGGTGVKDAVEILSDMAGYVLI